MKGSETTIQVARGILRSGKKVYCAGALFNPISRLAVSRLAAAVDFTLHEFAELHGLPIDGASSAFLPFRDTDQSKISGGDRAKTIFKLDIAALDASHAIAARIGGLVKDSGVAFELGYMFAKGRPIGVLCCDFMWEGFRDGTCDWRIDPLLQRMTTSFLSVPSSPILNLAYAESADIHDWNACVAFSRQFLNASESEFSIRSCQFTPAVAEQSIAFDFYGGRFRWCEDAYTEFESSMRSAYPELYFARRFCGEGIVEEREATFARDLCAAIKARVFVCCAEGLEMDSGAAAIVGARYALGRETWLLDSSPVGFVGEGHQKMFPNLMIDNSVSRVFTSVAQISEAMRDRQG